MDLTKLKVEKKEGRTLTLRHPGTGEDLKDEKTGNPVTIILLSQDSDRAKATRHRINNQKLLAQVAKGQRANLKSEDLTADGIRVLAALTVSWEGVELDGQPLECTPENAEKLYTEHEWVREQVDAFSGERANYLGN